MSNLFNSEQLTVIFICSQFSLCNHLSPECTGTVAIHLNVCPACELACELESLAVTDGWTIALSPGAGT